MARQEGRSVPRRMTRTGRMRMRYRGRDDMRQDSRRSLLTGAHIVTMDRSALIARTIDRTAEESRLFCIALAADGDHGHIEGTAGMTCRTGWHISVAGAGVLTSTGFGRSAFET